MKSISPGVETGKKYCQRGVGYCRPHCDRCYNDSQRGTEALHGPLAAATLRAADLVQEAVDVSEDGPRIFTDLSHYRWAAASGERDTAGAARERIFFG